jgi:hypothetical protein
MRVSLTDYCMTCTWGGDDGGTYYIRHAGNTVMWAGFSNDNVNAFNNGLTFSNVFCGIINGDSLTGTWVDVPRGDTMSSGTLNLQITTASDGEIQIKKISDTGGFGGSSWVPAQHPPPPSDIFTKFDHTIKNDGTTLHDNLKPYKDNVVAFGQIIDEPGLGYTNPDRSFNQFMKGDSVNGGDGDFTAGIAVDKSKLDSQPGFWTNDWAGNDRNPQIIMDKLNDNNYHMHTETIMWGDGFEPGWMENDGYSVMLNGHPINGQINTIPPFNLLGKEITLGTQIRVTGALVLDCGHFVWEGPIPLGHSCIDTPSEISIAHDNPSYHNVEIHPVYSIDIIQDFSQSRPNADLTGVYSGNSGETYYIRQIGNEIWALALSRDQGQTFSNTLKGTIQSDGSINAYWVAVPLGAERYSGSLTMNGDSADLSKSRSLSYTYTVADTDPIAPGATGSNTLEKLRDVPSP